jgi:acetate CoA/acetoacetate CoA-transferase alpha subunit
MNKQKNIEEVIASIPSGATIMVGGFGSPGTPFCLIEELLRQGQKNLTLIKNDANEPHLGISKLIEAGQVDRLITSHIGLNRIVVDKMNMGALEVRFFPQGILAEKIRTAGAGSYGFLTDIGIDTEITDPSNLIVWEGNKLKIESALKADYALVHAYKADTYGNLIYRGGAMNFSPLMAMAGNFVIAETANLLQPGELTPEQIHTPSAFVSAVVQLDDLTDDYQIMRGR